MENEEYFTHDKAYKTLLRRMNVKAHNFFHNKKANEITFIETEEVDTGKKGDVNYIEDGRIIQQNEIQSTPMTLPKLKDMFGYKIDLLRNKQYKGMAVQSNVINLTDPKLSVTSGLVLDDTRFGPNFINTQDYDGEKILNTLLDKCETQEMFTDDDEVSLLILQDTDISIHAHVLMEICCEILVNANISTDSLEDMFVCEVMMLKRFFKHEKVVSMIEMMKTKMKDEELVNTLKQYGPGLDYIYLEGM